MAQRVGALETLTLTLANISEPATCDNRRDYGNGVKIGNQFDIYFLINTLKVVRFRPHASVG